MSVRPIGMAVYMVGLVRMMLMPTPVQHVTQASVGGTAMSPEIFAVEHHNHAPTEAVLIIMLI